MKPVQSVVSLLFGAALSLLFVATVSAHAGYKSSTPARGEVVATSPANVEITFTQDIRKVAGAYGIDVANESGASVVSGPAVISEADRSQLSVPLRPSLPPGRYVVRWNNTSDDDGDPKEGAFSFYVGTQPTAADLQRDQALLAIGAEDETTPAATKSSAVGATPTVGAASTATGTSARTSVSTPVAVAPAKNDRGSNTPFIIAIVVIVAIVIAGGAGWFALSRRQR